MTSSPPGGWIRGVNIGGWLLAERFITPYLFAVNTCHLDGNLCWYPGQVGAPKNATICDPSVCRPVLPVPTEDGNNDFHPLDSQAYMGYPIDEMTLGQALSSPSALATRYMERHWDTFLTKQDLIDLKEAGVTHLRVPMGFWIRGDVAPGEAYVPGGWPYFVRAARWCREIGLIIWADLHGAPGSENGFDNSGQYKSEGSTCVGWSKHADNIKRTLDILQDLATAMVDEGLTDVVKGFGVLNEPFLDCDEGVLRNYYDAAFNIVRDTMGEDTSVFIGDMFRPWKFNNGFWVDDEVHHNTYLDTHPYHVFFEKGRAMTPRQHIAYVCRHNFFEVLGCCYEDHPVNTIPARGISRIFGEWSGAYDQLPTAMAPYIMKHIESNGIAPLLNRKLSNERMNFLQHFVQAQMVTYEAAPTRLSSGWLFWNFKMEGGAFAEWDFLRGIEEGWMPHIPKPSVSSESLYGNCYDILNRTTNNYTFVVDEFPDPRTLDWRQWQGWDFTDDFVLNDGHEPEETNSIPQSLDWIAVSVLSLVCILIVARKLWRDRSSEGYRSLK